MEIVPLTSNHFHEVASIYRQGIDTRIATFETAVPNWEQWDLKFLKVCRFVVFESERVVGWCALSPTSTREVYRGVAEVTIYICPTQQGKGIGKTLLQYLIQQSEKLGFWTLQASIFPQNMPSIAIHQKLGFREIGKREKIAQRDGQWHDNIIFERRSKNIQPMKNILVLCTGNSCRSQMAHGYLKSFAGPKANIYSAGIETHGLNPGAVNIMKEDGIDISAHTSNHVDEYEGVQWDFIITVCDHAYENCPFIPAPNAKRLHQNFFDPSKVAGDETTVHQAFEKARNLIKDYCRNFIEENL